MRTCIVAVMFVLLSGVACAADVNFQAEAEKLIACAANPADNGWPSIQPEGTVVCLQIPPEPPNEEVYAAFLACAEITSRDFSKWPNISPVGEVACVDVPEGLQTVLKKILSAGQK